MQARSSISLPALTVLALAALPRAQDPIPVAYPQRDILSPFRMPGEVYAPPDKLFHLLRSMREIAADPNVPRRFDAEGREIVDHGDWRAAYEEVQRLGIDAGMLAVVMRTSRNADHRATAFYAAFLCTNVDYVVNLISHIPGEPEAKVREQALPRAVEYLRVHLGRRFGDLDEVHKKEIVAALPQPGSPMAKAQGLTRAPVDSDHLHELRLVPFLQLLDVPEPLDQAQALWFLKEVFTIRADLALAWLEPSLPRVRQLLGSEHRNVREQAIGLLQAIAAKDLPAAGPDDEQAALQAWADRATRNLFPPIRSLNDTLVELHASPDRDAIAAKAKAAVARESTFERASGQTRDGQTWFGLRLREVPEGLEALALRAGVVLTTVNGVPIVDAATLRSTIELALQPTGQPRVVYVQYVRDDTLHAIEYRVM